MNILKYVVLVILILMCNVSYSYDNYEMNKKEISYMKNYQEVDIYINPCATTHHIKLEEMNLKDSVFLIALQLDNNISKYLDIQKTIVVTTPVNLDNFNITCPLSRIIQEGISNYFINRGYSVKELTVRDSTLLVKKMRGEFSLTRDVTLLSKESDPHVLVIGKYSMISDDEIFLDIKIVSSKQRLGVSSVDFIISIPPKYKSLVFNQEIEKKEKDIQPSDMEKNIGPIESGMKVLQKNNKEHIKMIQMRLKNLGLYRKKIDGIWGKATQQALETYKKIVGLKPYDVWDINTQKQLFKDTGL